MIMYRIEEGSELVAIHHEECENAPGVGPHLENEYPNLEDAMERACYVADELDVPLMRFCRQCNRDGPKYENILVL